MDLLTAMKQRHAVRTYEQKPLADDVLKQLEEEIELCNKQSGLGIKLITNEPKLFSSKIAQYGRFRGVENYILVAGPKSSDLTEKCGYYGQHLALKAQQLGLNTCWVAMMAYTKLPEGVKVNGGDKLVIVITVGYGTTQGVPHKSKTPQQVSNIDNTSPQWFANGVEGALLAPTALNQQKFYFELKGDKVKATAKPAFYSRLDLGIAKYQFELASAKDKNIWL